MVATGVGYSYITGGGGIIFSRAAVEQLLSLDSSCSCPKPDTPDDMHLGRCARQAAVPLLHSGRYKSKADNIWVLNTIML